MVHHLQKDVEQVRMRRRRTCASLPSSSSGRYPITAPREAQWLQPHQVDGAYFRMLPRGATEFSSQETAELARIFGKNGELRAERLS